MITIFNRRELMITTSMEAQAKAREALAAGGIEYSVSVTNLLAPHGSARDRAGSFGYSAEAVYEYKIYVHKRDYDRAGHLTGK